MEHDPTIVATRVRLVSAEAFPAAAGFRHRMYRPLVIRPAILFRPAGSDGGWHVDVEDDRFLPACPPTEQAILEVVRFHEAFGRTCRIAAALALPADGCGGSLRRFAPQRRRFPASRRRCIDIFGWAIMIERPGMQGMGSVDRHEHRAELPAFYECPLQLIDRSEFLTARGIRHRPLAVVVRPEDVAPGESGHTLPGRHRWHDRPRLDPGAAGPTPCSIADLLGG